MGYQSDVVIGPLQLVLDVRPAVRVSVISVDRNVQNIAADDDASPHRPGGYVVARPSATLEPIQVPHEDIDVVRRCRNGW